MKLKGIGVVSGILAVFLIYVYFSSPDEVIINKNGEVIGPINHLREAIQKETFWTTQLKTAKSELQWELNEPERTAKFNHETDKLLQEIDQYANEMYHDYPELIPSSAERKAEVLREKADKIEQKEFHQFFEKIRKERISELRKILPLIRLRIKQYNTNTNSSLIHR